VFVGWTIVRGTIIRAVSVAFWWQMAECRIEILSRSDQLLIDAPKGRLPGFAIEQSRETHDDHEQDGGIPGLQPPAHRADRAREIGRVDLQLRDQPRQ
jgi:hypothetical protein